MSILNKILSVKDIDGKRKIIICGIKITLKNLKNELSQFDYARKFRMPGHYYSPIPTEKDSEEYMKNKEKDVPNTINLNYNKQLELLHNFEKIYDEKCFANNENELNIIKGNSRFHHNNVMFNYSDAFGLNCFFRTFKPKNIIEIGCGFSSAVMLDTKDMYLKDEDINFTYIEPNPERLLRLVKEDDHINLIQKRLQDVDPNTIINNLNKGDLLFIDSTHVMKYNSDVLYIFNKILPNIKSGVYVHFHDIFYPFEYPDKWVQEGRFWNEAFLLKQFLSYNNEWEIKLWISMLYNKNPELIKEKFPLLEKRISGSIYLEKK